MIIDISPDLMAAKLHRQVLISRRNAADTTETLNVAYADAEAARTRLGQLEAEYRAVKKDRVA
ncbi:hypothetical protein [Pseudarthrobacter sp. S9]|uniref:hypothetical protein n=1 Tax=Pseudarthrobacter sp. S9 TaxID=3418421 RepID=UPI003D05F9BB